MLAQESWRNHDPCPVEYVPDLAAYVFGSYAKERPKISSDLDLALLTAYPKNPLERFKKRCRLAGELCLITGKEVDLIFLEEGRELVKYEIIKTGKLIYEANPQKNKEFVGQTIIKYLDFQYIERIMQSGMVRAIKEGR